MPLISYLSFFLSLFGVFALTRCGTRHVFFTATGIYQGGCCSSVYTLAAWCTGQTFNLIRLEPSFRTSRALQQDFRHLRALFSSDSRCNTPSSRRNERASERAREKRSRELRVCQVEKERILNAAPTVVRLLAFFFLLCFFLPLHPLLLLLLPLPPRIYVSTCTLFFALFFLVFLLLPPSGFFKPTTGRLIRQFPAFHGKNDDKNHFASPCTLFLLSLSLSLFSLHRLYSSSCDSPGHSSLLSLVLSREISRSLSSSIRSVWCSNPHFDDFRKIKCDPFYTHPRHMYRKKTFGIERITKKHVRIVAKQLST